MKKIEKILTSNGSIFLTTPNVNVWGKLDIYKTWKDMPIPKEYQDLPDLGHEYHYNIEEIEDIMKQSGLKIVKSDFSPLGGQRHFNMEIKKIRNEKGIYCYWCYRFRLWYLSILHDTRCYFIQL
jgi:hypothetical protein